MMRRILRRVVKVWVAVEGGGEEVGELELDDTEGMTGTRKKRKCQMRSWREERLILCDDIAVSRGESGDGRESLLSQVKFC